MLTQERNTPSRPGLGRAFPMAANAIIYKGAMVALDGGWAVPVTAKAGLVGVGRANQTVSNAGGANGAHVIEVEGGPMRYDNAPADPITLADIGHPAYGVDDATVARTSANDARSAVGTIFDVDADGVWVQF